MGKKERQVLVTYFDVNYLAKALVEYYSLNQFLDNFTLYMYCFDDVSFNVIESMKLENVVPVHCDEFENDQLREIKNEKERMYEYYWACVAYLIKRTMQSEEVETITYLDADLMFFSSPEDLLKMPADVDVLIQPNNFSAEEVSQFGPVGYYCSGWVGVRNNDNGNKVLDWWNSKCVEWCKVSFEEGKFGDQKYLDDWRIRFDNVREITEVGASIAPWNIGKYDLSKRGGKVLLNEKWSIIYYHYHSFRMSPSDYKYVVTGDRNNDYRVSKEVVELVYRPYIKEMKRVVKELKGFDEYEKYIELNPKGRYFVNKKVVNE